MPEPTPEQIAEAYHNLFEGQYGALVLADLRAKFERGTTVTVHPHRGIDPYETHFREGQRYVYQYLCELRTPPPPPANPNEQEQ
jgi:hypothetical protein